MAAWHWLVDGALGPRVLPQALQHRCAHRHQPKLRSGLSASAQITAATHCPQPGLSQQAHGQGGQGEAQAMMGINVVYSGLMPSVQVQQHC